MTSELLPVMVIVPEPRDIHTVKVKWPSDSFKTLKGVQVDQAYRQKLSQQCQNLQVYFSDYFSVNPGLPAVAKVILRKKALAKYRRPYELLKRSCPIIGVDDFTELLVMVTPDKIEKLSADILKRTANNCEVYVSGIKQIKPYTPQDVLSNLSLSEIDKPIIKVRLFRFPSTTINRRLQLQFKKQVEELGLASPERLDYGRNLSIFKVLAHDATKVEKLARFAGVRRMSLFPSYAVVKSQATPIREIVRSDLPVPQSGIHYPVVGLIDSGTDPQNGFLAAWINKRWERVPINEQDNTHGSFIAGLLINARGLNHGSDLFPNLSCRIVDIVVLPGYEGILEPDLLECIEEALKKFPQAKVWNLSLGVLGFSCDTSSVSDLAMKLDKLQDKYNVRFVIAGGNLLQNNLRPWPVPASYSHDDRICPPADSVRAITVGSLAHLMNSDSCVQVNEPSPFSRRGPGPSWIPKPEVTHYGGNCNESGDYSQTGVLSVDANGWKSEDIGTSYSTPLVSATLAHMYHMVPGISHALAKALLIHSAVCRFGRLTEVDIPYQGFGIPAGVMEALTCARSEATIIFEPTLELSNYYAFIKHNFPLPNCLKNIQGAFRGEIIMTLVYDPPLDPRFGAEYCRSNVDASLGTYELDESGKPVNFGSLIPMTPAPRDLKNMYEEHLIEHGFKWSPVKVYRKKFPRGVGGKKHWMLQLKAQRRKEYLARTKAKTNFKEKQKVAVIITIRDTKGEAPVYTEVRDMIKSQNWLMQYLKIRSPQRLKVR